MQTSAILDVEEFEKGLFAYPLKYRYIFLVLVETGFRISDVLNLKVRDIRRGKSVTEKKTRKKRALELSEGLKESLLAYAKSFGLRSEDFLFPSTRGNLCRPVSRYQVHRIFKGLGATLGLEGVISVHSCRKTYARQEMAKHGDLERLQKDFGHSSKKITRGYLD